MTPGSSHGADSRRPVYSGARRVPGLYERTRADGTNVYEAALRLGGKARRRTLTASTKTDAIAELRALQVDYWRGEQHRSGAGGLTVADVAHDWLAHLDARVEHPDPRRRYKKSTVTLYRQRLRQHVLPELGHLAVSEVNTADLCRLIDRLGVCLAPSAATSTVNIVSGLYRYAIKCGMAERNPVRDLDRDDRPGTARLTEPRYLSAAEIERLLARLSDTFRPIAFTCAYAGLRISEVLGLRWCDLDLAGSAVTVSGQLDANATRVTTKSLASTATVPMLPALARELRDHRSRLVGRDLRLIHGDGLVFTTSRGKPQSRRNALRAVHAAGDAVGLNGDGREKVGLHDLRHSFVALALVEVSLADAAGLARHANARVTSQVYAGITDNGLSEAAAKLVRTGFGA